MFDTPFEFDEDFSFYDESYDFYVLDRFHQIQQEIDSEWDD